MSIAALTAKNVCYECVRENFLRSAILKKPKRQCSYCGKRLQCFTLQELAECVAAAFEDHYVLTPERPDYWTSDMDTSREGYPVVDAIADAAEVSEEIAGDVQQILEDDNYDEERRRMGEECPFDSESYYDRKGVDLSLWHDEWEYFQDSLRTQTRFFSQAAADTLSSVFDGLHKIRASDGRPVVVRAGPGTDIASLYRARAFQSADKLREALAHPHLHLGPPPAHLASAGRMNAAGISVFYGANEAEVAIAEVRPPVGANVLVACFDIIRPIRLLDLRVLEEVSTKGSIFDPEYAKRLERAAFLKTVSKRISRPVMPDDEIFGYIPTQAIADYLATATNYPVHGIIFRSVQSPGDAFNVVLFHHAAGVEFLELPIGTMVQVDMESSTADGVETEYSVMEWVPPAKADEQAKPKKKKRRTFADLISDPTQLRPDGRLEETLRIVIDSVTVHSVQRVEFKTDPYPVSRQREDQPDWMRAKHGQGESQG